MTQALDDLLEALEDVDDATREEAAKILAEKGDPKSLDALISACGDDYWSVRAYAGCGVAKIGGQKALEALIGLFNDPIMEVRNQAVEATARLGTAILDRMIAAMKDERWRVREHAAKTCGEIRDKIAILCPLRFDFLQDFLPQLRFNGQIQESRSDNFHSVKKLVSAGDIFDDNLSDIMWSFAFRGCQGHGHSRGQITPFRSFRRIEGEYRPHFCG